MSDPIIVLTTFPDEASALQTAQHLVEAQLAACVNVLPPMTSVYTWNGEAQTDPEHLLLMKTRQACYASLEQAILEQHPYDLPEIVATPIVAGLAGYLDWIAETTRDA